MNLLIFVGRRECAGKSLANMTLFMFFVTVLQRYHVTLPGDSTVTDKPLTDFFNITQPFKIIYTPR